MKAIHYYIYATMSLALLSCSASDEAPSAAVWGEGEAPLSMRAIAPQQGQADFTERYDIYTCAAYYAAPLTYEDYYSESTSDNIIFRQMVYDTYDIEETGTQGHLYYMPGCYFYPLIGKMDLLSYGVPAGKSIKARPVPEIPQKDESAEYMVLALDKDYDGSFEVIAADRITVECSSKIQPKDLPFAHFHFIQAHVHFKFKWDSSLAADAGIKSRLKINSVRMENTPCQGEFYVKDNVADGFWEAPGPDAVLTKEAAPQAIPDDSDGLDFGDIYIVPQTSRQHLVINYTIQNGSDNADADKRTMNYVVQDKTKADIAKGWLAGHDYTYIINIGEGGNFIINKVNVEPFAPGNVGKTVIY